jgi:HTH-type transcriptional regulator/antitoxin HigA
MNMTRSQQPPFEARQFQLIRNDAELKRALGRIEQLMDAQAGSAEGEELEIWAMLVERYEDAVVPMDELDPVAAIEQVVAIQGLRKRDLVPVLGSPSRVTDVLARRRRLTLGMIRRAHEMLGLPLEVLIQPCNLRNEEED